MFTVGLTFATIELPELADQALKGVVRTPGGDSHVDEAARIRTELFLAHTHLRAVGYTCFLLTAGLVAAGFVSRRSGLSAVGAGVLLLPVFAQFAAVMFFLAGLGILNALWLPLLDVSFGVSRLGMIIRAPYDLAAWLLARFGVRGPWPIPLACLGLGGLIFFLGVFAWLDARFRPEPVASRLVYRISRHPQYLGWIVWSYGVYLLLLAGRYPKRSWSLDASLPWLLSTMTILGVALLEELRMGQRAGGAWESYRARAPFLLPLPRFVGRVALLPQRLLFGSGWPARRREVAALVGTWTIVLVAASALTYGGGLAFLADRVTPAATREARLDDLVARIRREADGRARRRLVARLASRGPGATAHLLELLADPDEALRNEAASQLTRHPDTGAVPRLVEALSDVSPGVRWNAVRALARTGAAAGADPIASRLDDPEPSVRRAATEALARIGDRRALPAAVALSGGREWWDRVAALDALGALGDTRAVRVAERRLEDESVEVRRAAVIALLRLGSREAVPALRRAALDPDWETRIYAVEAVKRLE